MGFVESGGYVVTLTTGNQAYRRRVKVDNETLSKIADALGIPQEVRAQLISDGKSIYIHRGAGPGRPEPKR